MKASLDLFRRLDEIIGAHILADDTIATEDIPEVYFELAKLCHKAGRKSQDRWNGTQWGEGLPSLEYGPIREAKT